jgi:hypothetical protein
MRTAIKILQKKPVLESRGMLTDASVTAVEPEANA